MLIKQVTDFSNAEMQSPQYYSSYSKFKKNEIQLLSMLHLTEKQIKVFGITNTITSDFCWLKAVTITIQCAVSEEFFRARSLTRVSVTRNNPVKEPFRNL